MRTAKRGRNKKKKGGRATGRRNGEEKGGRDEGGKGGETARAERERESGTASEVEPRAGGSR